MKNWEKAEQIVKKISGGYSTIGSGNKGQRGDVLAHGYRIEVKQTDNVGSITLLSCWFDTLEKLYHSTDLEVVLCIFFGLIGYCYVLDRTRTTEGYSKWSSMKLEKSDLPDKITTKRYVWVLKDIDFLKELKENEQSV